jgi:purine nucleoside permease
MNRSAAARFLRIPASPFRAPIVALAIVMTLFDPWNPAALASDDARPVKVLIISMFAPEGQVWIDHLGLDEAIPIPGLSADYPAIHCNADDVCQMTTGMGHANAAASTMAILLSGRFDLRRAYILIAGIAGIDPTQGTTGTAAWARYVVDYGISWEIDAREMPADWPNGYIGIFTTGPGQKPSFDYRTELFQLNETLLQTVLSLTGAASLVDSPAAQAYRANYPGKPANEPPKVVQCDTMAGDTWFSGNYLGERASSWTRTLTDGKGVYCTTEQEDTATMNALTRGAQAGLVDLARVAILRTASDFDRPYPGQDAFAGLSADHGGFGPAIANLYAAGSPFVADVVAHWPAWRRGVPK